MKIELLLETDRANQKIASIISKIEKPNEILKSILIYIMPEIQLHIINQENPANSTWGKKYLPPVADPIRRALITKNGNYINSFKYRLSGNSIEIFSTHPGVFTHEMGLEIKNLFGKGIVYQFPQRSAVWLSQKAIEKIIPDIIRKELNNV